MRKAFKIARMSPGMTLESATSTSPPTVRRCASVGIRFASAASNRRSVLNRVAFERLAAREHQHDERTRQVLVQQNRRNHRDSGQQVRPELSLRKNFAIRLRTGGTPPKASTASSGTSCVGSAQWIPKRRSP